MINIRYGKKPKTSRIDKSARNAKNRRKIRNKA